MLDSFSFPVPKRLSNDESPDKQKQAIATGAVEDHVRRVAVVIGERNRHCPAAAVLVEKTWPGQGYEFSKHVCEIHDQLCAGQ